ncbi:MULTISPECIES: hypothetical protein [unclassified Thioalkalivibrio]|uniref:hypothetical protein n=1 Tax=unclassified Thioalkalivibrio TaxID=2621013 RepID=UPI000365259B|nr:MULTISPECIES: hypothetical protein [unclassified Thioalkalivibrio]
MIASFLRNFVFIKTRKTAGTSVEIVLSPFCAGDDIVSPMVPEDELLRAEWGGLPMNYCERASEEQAYRNAIIEGDMGLVGKIHREQRKRLRANGYYGHMPAESVAAKLPELWENALTFTVERHPYEKVVSRAYWWTRSRNDDRNIDDIIEDVIADPRLSDKYLYARGDRILVDRVIMFDRLWEEVSEIITAFGGSVSQRRPAAKGYTRKDRRSAAEILSDSQKRRVRDRCAFEFEVFEFAR